MAERSLEKAVAQAEQFRADARGAVEKATRIVEHTKEREKRALQEAEAARAGERAAMDRERALSQAIVTKQLGSAR